MITAAQVASGKKVKERKTWRTQKVVLRSSLFRLRKDLGLTMRDVSQCGVDVASVARAEQGFQITLTHALLIARFFEKPVEEIWSALEQRNGARKAGK